MCTGNASEMYVTQVLKNIVYYLANFILILCSRFFKTSTKIRVAQILISRDTNQFSNGYIAKSEKPLSRKRAKMGGRSNNRRISNFIGAFVRKLSRDWCNLLVYIDIDNHV